MLEKLTVLSCLKDLDPGDTLCSLRYDTAHLKANSSPRFVPPRYSHEAAQEDKIIPTLAFANEFGQGLVNLLSIRRRLVEASGDSEEWEKASDGFTKLYGSLRPVRVADGLVILERLPVSIQIETGPDEGTPEEVNITVHAHRRLAKPEHMAPLYEKVLSDANVPHDEQQPGN